MTQVGKSPQCNDLAVCAQSDGDTGDLKRLASEPSTTALPAPNGQDRVDRHPKLAHLVAAYAPHDGTFDLAIPGLHASRLSNANAECVHTIQVPSLCLIADGAKTITVGDQVHHYDASRALVVSVSLPIAAAVTRATGAKPYLAVRLDLDPRRIADLVLKVYPHGLPPMPQHSGAFVTSVDLKIVDAVTRLMECLSQSGDMDLLAPLMIDEILIRLLRSANGPRVAQMGLVDSGVDRVAKATAWLRANFARPMRVEDLAELVHMSVSSFHEHFKSVTSMSPLQYQKMLRLQEARRLMLSTAMEAGTTAQLVGYASTSHFSRDYSRLFGRPPAQDVARIRQETQVSV